MMMAVSVSVRIFTLFITGELHTFPFLQGGGAVEGESVQGQPEGGRCSG